MVTTSESDFPRRISLMSPTAPVFFKSFAASGSLRSLRSATTRMVFDDSMSAVADARSDAGPVRDTAVLFAPMIPLR